MNYLTHKLLNTEELEILRKNLDKKELSWQDGKQTAGEHAAKVKNNLQLRRDSDLSFTLSLTNKDFYEGGELIIETMNSEEKFKLNAGEIILYPSSYLHSVSEVTKGERLVCVGWIESYVK